MATKINKWQLNVLSFTTIMWRQHQLSFDNDVSLYDILNVHSIYAKFSFQFYMTHSTLLSNLKGVHSSLPTMESNGLIFNSPNSFSSHTKKSDSNLSLLKKIRSKLFFNDHNAISAAYFSTFLVLRLCYFSRRIFKYFYIFAVPKFNTKLSSLHSMWSQF